MVEVTPQSQNINKTYDAGHTYTRNYDQVKQEFEQLNVGPINTACTEWSALARNLGTISEQIRREVGDVLHDAWESKSSADAQQHLQVAQGTAEALANHSMTMARATDYAYQYASWYQAHLPGDGYVTTGGDSQRAVDHLVKLLGRYDEVIALLPSQVQTRSVNANPQDIGGPDSTPGGPGAGGAPHMGGAGAKLPGSGGTGGLPGSGLGDGNTGFDGSGLGNGSTGGGLGSGGTGGLGSGSGGLSPYDPGSQLAGGGGLGGLGSGHPGGGLGGGGLGSGGVGSGLGSGGLGSGPGGIGSGSGAGVLGTGAGRGGPGSGAGTGAGGPGAGGRGSAGAGGVGGAPMHGGGQGDEDERERSTWLTEDEDVWGGNADVPPPVIGG